MPHFGVIHAQFSSPENCMTWSWLQGYAANTDSRRELTQTYQQRRCFQENQVISRRCFLTCFAAFHFCKNRSSKEFGDSRSRQGHTPCGSNRVHTHWEPNQPPAAIYIGLRFTSPKWEMFAYLQGSQIACQRNPKDMNSRRFCFTVRWVHRSVPWTEELFRPMAELGIRCICEFLGTFLLVFSVAWQGM